VAELEKYPVPLYEPDQPYHWEFDNLPLEALKLRDEAINGQLEYVAGIVRDSNGTQGTLSNRLAQSLEDDGSLKDEAIDEAEHNIAEHTDGTRTLDSEELEEIESLGYDVTNPVPFVRMLEAERDKLALITNEATDVTIHVETPSNVVIFDDGSVVLVSSPTVTWEVASGNNVKANLAFPVEAAHRHYYDLEPITSDYQNYEVTSVATPFVEGSLRVYVNGIKLSSSAEIYVPGNLVTDTWTLNSFTPDHEAGTFELSNVLTEDDIIRIDFDITLT